jgi:tetratricopeptide (TPR) repeat protein
MTVHKSINSNKLRPCAIAAFVFLFTCLLAIPTPAVMSASDSEQLISSSIAQKFYDIACELSDPESAHGGPTAENFQQAIIFLTAATTLDSKGTYIYPKEIMLLCRSRFARNISDANSPQMQPEQNYSEPVYQLLLHYVDKSSDLGPAREAAKYLLDRLNSRDEREKFLEELLKNLGGKNKSLDSELETLLGLLKAEKADANTAISFFMQAYNDNKHNRLAFEKLIELTPEQISSAMYLENLRLALDQNPLDMKAALAFAQYAASAPGGQLYEVAADTYEYCADLFSYLRPAEPLPAYIYIPWAINCYNSPRNLQKCMQIADTVRKSGRFDLILEAIAGKAAAKTGDSIQAGQIFQNAQEKAISNFNSAPADKKTLIASELAWFYCFTLPDADKSLEWANKAYSIDPNSPTAASLLAYSLAINGQAEWAKQIIKTFSKTIVADLATAHIQLTEGQKDVAAETLKSAINADPGSLEAERAKEILTQQGKEYTPPVDSGIILAALKNSPNETIVPKFTKPDKIISAQLNFRGSKFSYESDFGGSLAIVNNSAEPLIISDDGLFTGQIRIDANLTGDLSRKIPNLLSMKIQPALPVEPGGSLIIPLRLFTGQLRQILLTHPQASLNIEFTLYLDPVINDAGRPANRLSDIKPATLTVQRPRVELDNKFLQNRLDTLKKGQQGQRIKAAQLFAGLLMEQSAFSGMARRQPPYKFTYADWMPPLLKSAMSRNLADEDWVVRVHTMASMISLPLDYELIDALSKDLNDTNWPVRMMAMYLLAKSQAGSFNNVLDWTAQYDSNKLVADMAIALGGTAPLPVKQAAPPADANADANSQPQPPRK